MATGRIVLTAITVLVAGCNAAPAPREPDPSTYDRTEATVRIRGARETVAAARVDPGFFAAGQAQALLGRTFIEGEVVPVVVLGYELWQGMLGGDPSWIGRALSIDGEDTIVVGVMPEGYASPSDVRLWLPRAPVP